MDEWKGDEYLNEWRNEQWPTDWLTQWMNESNFSMNEWMGDEWMTDWLTDWLNKRKKELIDWLNEWRSNQNNYWLKNWTAKGLRASLRNVRPWRMKTPSRLMQFARVGPISSQLLRGLKISSPQPLLKKIEKCRPPEPQFLDSHSWHHVAELPTSETLFCRFPL